MLYLNNNHADKSHLHTEITPPLVFPEAIIISVLQEKQIKSKPGRTAKLVHNFLLLLFTLTCRRWKNSQILHTVVPTMNTKEKL